MLRKWSWPRTLGRIGAVAAIAMAAHCGGAQAETRHALLVGVNEYRNLSPASWLVGPANDVARILDHLTGSEALGFSRDDIIVLANGPVEADGEPDRLAILEAMASLADRVEPGDFVYLHFGGHGSRQKAADPGSEPDGLDEIFLPADTGRSSGGIYPNALVDNEIGEAIDRIRAAGAFVWAVFDSCHSSSATRGSGVLSDEVAQRWLPDAGASGGESAPPTAEELRESPLRRAEFSAEPGVAAGGLVTFFAAQTVETTPEMPLPRRQAGARRHGLFTYTLFDVLARRPNLTYRELAQGVMHAYSVGNFSRPTPLFEGDLDRVVFGQEAEDPILQWPLEIAGGLARLAAGRLHRLEKDGILAILPDPLADLDAALGYLRLIRVETMSAIAVPVEHDGMAAPKLADLPAGIYARPVSIPLAFELAVQLPDPGATRFAEAVSLARTTVARIAADTSLPMNLRLVEPGEPADLRLVVNSEAELYPTAEASSEPRLWFLPPDGRFPADRRLMPHSIGLNGGFSDERLAQTKENLAAVFRATSLSRLSVLSDLDRTQIEAQFFLHRKTGGEVERLDGVAVPVVSAGDEIHIRISNRSANPVDVDVLLIGSNYAIQHMMGERFQPKGRLETPLVGVGPSTFGLRRVLLVMREARRNSPHDDLGFLEQVGVQTRGPEASGARSFEQLLDDIAHAPPTRSAAAYRSKSNLKGSLEIFSFESVP